MLSFHPANMLRPRAYPGCPAYGADTLAFFEAVAAREAAEREFEIARLKRIARANRHAETER